ncbi:MAG: lipopolysaccharide biosynthesis protein, partial [Bacteroidales bacterium]|nr:lipopolysaccharide biosynthesis protein [Bacteroidales bacterium]
MTVSSLKHKATKGFLWSFLEKFSVRGGQVAIGSVLARLLTPSDFGLIAMLTIFINISHSLVDSGLRKSLVQKQECEKVDFSTVFVFNLLTGIVLYGILFIIAPLIALFYDKPELINLLRVLGITLVFEALNIVQSAKLIIALDFKTIAKINVISVFFGGGVGILAALYGLGVWALVIQISARVLSCVVLFWFLGDWKLSLKFSFVSFKQLFRFGSNILLAGIYAEFMNNLNNIFIGKYFSASFLGFYSRARNFTHLASDTVSQAMVQVTFPVLSSLNNEKDRMLSVFKQALRMSAFSIFPILTLLSLLAEPIVRVLLTDEWLPVVPLLQWMAFSRIMYPMSALNINLLNAIGRSDLFLKVDLLKFPLNIIVLLITLPISVKAMVIGQVVYFLVEYFFNAYFIGKFYSYGGIKQVKDILPTIMSTIVMAACTLYSISFVDLPSLKLFVGVSVAFISY